MKVRYADQPLIGSVDSTGAPCAFPLEGLRRGAELSWDTDDVHCGTCGHKATRELSKTVAACDCRCHEAWRLWFRMGVQS